MTTLWGLNRSKLGLERDASPELDIARAAAFAEDFAKAEVVVNVGRWITNTNPVEEVNRIDTELEVHAFANSEIGAFDEREILTKGGESS